MIVDQFFNILHFPISQQVWEYLRKQRTDLEISAKSPAIMTRPMLKATWDHGPNSRMKKPLCAHPRYQNRQQLINFPKVFVAICNNNMFLTFVSLRFGYIVLRSYICLSKQEEKKELDEILAKRSKKGKKVEEAPAEEKTTLHSETAAVYKINNIGHRDLLKMF